MVADTFYTFTNLFPGTYIVNVAAGISNSQDTIVAVQIQNNTVVYATSPTNCDGEIVSIINGGFAPITHYWSGPNGYTSNSKDIANLSNWHLL